MQGMRYQPQGAARLNPSTPLVLGLVHSWGGVNAMGPLAVRDMAGRAHGVFGTGVAGSPSGNSWRVGPGGYYLNFDDSGTGQTNSINLKVGDANGSGGPGGNTFSVAARIRVPGFTSSAATIYGSVPGGIQVRIGGTGQVELIKEQTLVVGMSATSIQAGVDVDIGVTYDGATAAFYINGVLSGSSANSQTFTLNGQYCLGYAEVVNERVLNGTRIYRLDVWNRPLVAGEFKSWSDNPWQIFTDRYEEDFEATAATTTISPARAAFTVTGFAPSVARGVTTNVQPGTGALSVTGYAPSVTQGLTKTISPAPASLTVTGYAPDVSQTAARTTNPGPAALTITGYPPTVSRGASLTVAAGAPAALAVTGYAPTVTQANNVTPHMYGATIMRLSAVRSVADLGPDRIQQTADLL